MGMWRTTALMLIAALAGVLIGAFVFSVVMGWWW
jgi:hypothetical protein